jgi:hypothetical protein
MLNQLEDGWMIICIMKSCRDKLYIPEDTGNMLSSQQRVATRVKTEKKYIDYVPKDRFTIWWILDLSKIFF